MNIGNGFIYVRQHIYYNNDNICKLGKTRHIYNRDNIVNNIYITRNGPGGRSGELQFNEDGAYIGDSGLLYDPNTDTLTTGTINITQLNANNANLGSVNNLTILGGNNNNVLKGYSNESGCYKYK